MKKKFLFSASVACASLALLSSCAGDFDSGKRDGRGGIAPVVDIDAVVIGAEVTSKASASDPAPAVGDLTLRVSSVDNPAFAPREWKLSDFPADEQFPIGDYNVEAFHADRNAQGFECSPAYHASATVKVIEAQTTPVNLSVKRTHASLAINYTDAFLNYVSRATTTVSSSTGFEAAFVMSESFTESRTALIVPGKTTVSVGLTKKTGTVLPSAMVAEFTAAAASHYAVTVDINGGEIGAGKLVVTFDDSVDAETIEIDLSDEAIAAPAPEFTLEGFTSGDQFSFVETSYNGDPVRVGIIARGGIASVNLAVKSSYLRDYKGWGESTDLISDATSHLTQSGLVLRGFDGNVDQMAVIDFTKLISAIEYLDSDAANGNVSSFSVQVTDRNGKTTEAPVDFSVKLDKLHLELSNPSQLDIYATSLTADVDFNGISDRLSFTYRNERGIEQALTVDQLTETSAGHYTASLSGLPSNEQDVVLTAHCGKVTSTLTILRKGVVVTATPEDVFATHAYIHVRPVNVELQSPVFKDAAGNALTATEQAGGVYHLTGLTPTTELTAQLSIDDPSILINSVTFTTEEAKQLVNGNLEQWETTATGSNWERWAVDGWATYNPMTTGETGLRNATAYVNRSGTARSAAAHSGSYAAELRTIGWGAGNSAVGSISSDNPKHLNKGMLYLGTSPTQLSNLETQAQKGIEFASRPSSISFWYKYSPKNAADYGGMKVWVKDAQGNIIAQGSQSNLSATSYTQITVPLTYAKGANKAAQIYVEFASSDNPAWDTREKAWFDVPAFGNLNNGKFQGSSLFIDDIVLTY